MKNLQWENDSEFSIYGVRFRCADHNYALKTDLERIVILKDREVLANYAAVFSDAPPRRILEFGIFQGGSPALFALWFDVEKFVGIDISEPVHGFDEFCRRHPIGAKIWSHYSVSQTDARKVKDIIGKEFGSEPLDVIIDDASHLYGSTRRTFEIAFPHLRPGGIYVIEDWGWAHWPASGLYPGRTALSMLIMELTMLCASRRDIISEVRVFPSVAFIMKAPIAPHIDEFTLDALYTKRGIELVGSEHANLKAVGKLVVRSFGERMARRFKRLRQRVQRSAY